VTKHSTEQEEKMQKGKFVINLLLHFWIL